MLPRGSKPRSPRDRVVEAMLRRAGVELRSSRFSDRPALWIEGREFLHYHPGDDVDIRLTRAVIRELRAELRDDPRAAMRGSSDWIEYTIDTDAAAGVALRLAERAAAANRRR
jgi:hypothetical protein